MHDTATMMVSLYFIMYIPVYNQCMHAMGMLIVTMTIIHNNYNDDDDVMMMS